MMISERLRSLREDKNLSQGDIETRTGLKRCYISRVENGHTVPSIPTLEKFARALDVPMYLLFYDGDEPAQPPPLLHDGHSNEIAWGTNGRDARTLHRFRRAFEQISSDDRNLLLHLAAKMSKKQRSTN